MLLSVLMIITVLALAGCDQQPSAKVARSAKQWATSPDVDPSDLADLVDGNSAFALVLVQVR